MLNRMAMNKQIRIKATIKVLELCRLLLVALLQVKVKQVKE